MISINKEYLKKLSFKYIYLLMYIKMKLKTDALQILPDKYFKLGSNLNTKQIDLTKDDFNDEECYCILNLINSISVFTHHAQNSYSYKDKLLIINSRINRLGDMKLFTMPNITYVLNMNNHYHYHRYGIDTKKYLFENHELKEERNKIFEYFVNKCDVNNLTQVNKLLKYFICLEDLTYFINTRHNDLKNDKIINKLKFLVKKTYNNAFYLDFSKNAKVKMTMIYSKLEKASGYGDADKKYTLNDILSLVTADMEKLDKIFDNFILDKSIEIKRFSLEFDNANIYYKLINHDNGYFVKNYLLKPFDIQKCKKIIRLFMNKKDSETYINITQFINTYVKMSAKYTELNNYVVCALLNDVSTHYHRCERNFINNEFARKIINSKIVTDETIYEMYKLNIKNRQYWLPYMAEAYCNKNEFKKNIYDLLIADHGIKKNLIKQIIQHYNIYPTEKQFFNFFTIPNADEELILEILCDYNLGPKSNKTYINHNLFSLLI